METLLGIFSAFGLSASAGLNAYIPLLVVALMAKFTNWIHLEAPWDALTSWWIIGLLSILLLIEFFVDKIPVVHHVNDAIQTFVRPAAGAVVFAANTNVVSGINPVAALALGLIVAGGVHATKSAVIRPVVGVASGGSANVPVSMAEDATSTAVSIASIVAPLIVFLLLIVFASWAIYYFFLREKPEPPRKRKAQ
jgi:hypothetical protein